MNQHNAEPAVAVLSSTRSTIGGGGGPAWSEVATQEASELADLSQDGEAWRCYVTDDWASITVQTASLDIFVEINTLF